MPTDVTRTYLELTDPAELRGGRAEDAAVHLAWPAAVTAEQYRALYLGVGAAYHWRDRAEWPDAQIEAHLARPEIHLGLLTVAGATAGYFELERHHDGAVELVYFGLLPRYHGRGLGKHLLTEAVERAWELGAVRVWLHTCTLDGPAALPNYRQRGFRPFRQERYTVDLPVDSAGSA